MSQTAIGGYTTNNENRGDRVSRRQTFAADGTTYASFGTNCSPEQRTAAPDQFQTT